MIILLLMALLIMAATGKTSRQHTGISACVIVGALVLLLLAR